MHVSTMVLKGKTNKQIKQTDNLKGKVKVLIKERKRKRKC